MKSKLSERDKARIPVLEENLKKAQMEALNIEAEIEKIMSNYLPRKLVMEFFVFCFLFSLFLLILVFYIRKMLESGRPVWSFLSICRIWNSRRVPTFLGWHWNR